MAFHPFSRTACVVSWVCGMQITSLNLEKNGDEGMPCTSWCYDWTWPENRVNLVKEPDPRGRIYRDLDGFSVSATVGSPVRRIFVLRRQNGATWLSPAPSFKLFTRQNTETRAWCAKRMGGGTDSPSPLPPSPGTVGNEVTFVPKLIFKHKGVAANNRRRVDAY